ncbi:MAG: methyltransferase [Oscillospiraceae bacterium]|nr:methyltransferase [Oscillospiraceae bacterium]
MSILMCPKCSMPLKLNEKTYRCVNNHCYDISKKGYVNLLMSQKSSKKRHGDDKAMIYARKSFLSKGYYDMLCDNVIGLAKKHFAGGAYLDLGCGECYYTERIKNAVSPSCTVALDISKDALNIAQSDAVKIVASVSKIPVFSDSCNLVTNIFAPIKESEVKRVLTKNGLLVRAVPLERHLFSLKSAVYEKPYENAHDETALEGFELVDSTELKTKITIDNNEDILKLFMMTPYYYKTSSADFQRLNSLDTLETEIEVNFLAYKPLK